MLYWKEQVLLTVRDPVGWYKSVNTTILQMVRCHHWLPLHCTLTR